MREFSSAQGGQKADKFVPTATFEQMADLYVFDRQLRLLCFEALETIERRIKVAVAYIVGQTDPFAHDNGSMLSPQHMAIKPGKTTSAHTDWCNAHKSKIKRLSNEAIGGFVSKYGQPLPIWVAIDAMDFGDISRLLSMFGKKTQNRIAHELGVSGRDVVSWTRSMNLVRNISAHHDRLWNRELVDVPTKPKGPEAEWFSDVLDNQRYWSRSYTAILVIAYFSRQIDPSTNWPTRMGNHLLKLPEGNGISIGGLGAPENWMDNKTWSDLT